MTMGKMDYPTPSDWDRAVDRLNKGGERAKLAVNYIDHKGKHLDIGTGQGQFLEQLNKKSVRCFGLDYGSKSTRICKEKGFLVVQGDARYLPFKSNAFRSLSFLDVIEHVPDFPWALEEAARVLDHGGKLILTTPDSTSIQELVLKFLREVKIVSYKQPYDSPIPHGRLKDEIKAQGLKINLIKRFGKLRYYLVVAIK